MNPYFEKLKGKLAENPPSLGDADSILALLYEAYNELNSMDDDRIKADFHALYEAMNGMPLQEMDRIIYPVCRLCRDHQRSGFMDGIKVGFCLQKELEGE